MKKILVPIDYTPASRNAEVHAASLARVFGADLHLLHVFGQPGRGAEVPTAWMLTTSELQRENEGLVAKEARALGEKFHLHVSGSARVGFKGDTICAVARKEETDLIVMGRKEDQRNWLLGNTTVTVIRKSQTPVLIVPWAAPFKPLTNIVLAADYDEVDDTASFGLFFRLVDAFAASVQVLHVQPKDAVMKACEVPGKMQLGRVLSRLTYGYEPVVSDDVEEGILRYIRTRPADLLVMVAHRHGLFERIFGKVHTQYISYELPIPLLILEDK